MPRTSGEFSNLDPGEQKNVSIGFGTPGEPGGPLAVGEKVTAATCQLTVLSGADLSPSSRLIGPLFIQPGGLIVTQKIGAFQAQSGTVYQLQVTALTNLGQTLTPFSRLAIN